MGCPESSHHALVRQYSLSCGPAKTHLRISVKRDGVVSRYLHDHVQAGDNLLVRLLYPTRLHRCFQLPNHSQRHAW